MTTSSADFYTKEVVEKRIAFFKKSHNVDKTTKYLISLAVEKLSSINKPFVLDIGTGNGYVLAEISKRLGLSQESSLKGIDLSENMINVAKELCKHYSHIEIIKGDNFALPFEDETFDVVTNKVTTNFSMSEVYRVLKSGGWFIFKEYSLGKGFKEVTELFASEGRVKFTDPLIYLKRVRDMGFKYCSYEQFLYSKQTDIQMLLETLRMAPMISNFSESDERRIKDALGSEELTITTDPFIMQCQK